MFGVFFTFCLTVISKRSGVLFRRGGLLFLLIGLRLPDLLDGLGALAVGPGPFPLAPLLNPPITCFGGSSFFVSIFFIGSLSTGWGVTT